MSISIGSHVRAVRSPATPAGLILAVVAAVASSATAGYEPASPAALVHGYSVAFVVAAAIAVGCAILALGFIRGRRSPGGEVMRRPLMDTIEVRAPGLAALVLRGLLRLPLRARRKVLDGAFTRAEAAFNRGDFEAVLALFADDVVYVPPPALHRGPAVIGRPAVLRFWQDVLARYDSSTIVNLSVQETSRNRFVRMARLTHDGPDGSLAYAIRQTTDLHRGRVVRQVNEQV